MTGGANTAPMSAANPSAVETSKAADVPRTDSASAAGVRRHPLGVDGLAELATLERNGVVESRHLGTAVAVGPDGEVLRALGDVDADVLGRSSLKLFQSVAVQRAGAVLAGERAALSAASHSGTAEHVRVVEAMLADAGLTDSALQCPAAWSTDADAAFDARLAGLGRRRIAMNCSGKHAGFLAACVHRGWDIDAYLDPAHPVQRLVVDTLEELTGDRVGAVAVDGCGAPVFGTTLVGLARATGRVTGAGERGDDPIAARLCTAILDHPWAIDGPGRANTVVVERLGIVAKLGAEGVFVLGTADGSAVALKVADGSLRAITAIGIRLLASVGLVDAELGDAVIEETTPPVLGGGVPVGALRASF